MQFFAFSPASRTGAARCFRFTRPVRFIAMVVLTTTLFGQASAAVGSAAFAAALAPTLLGQAVYDNPGPFAVGWRDEVLPFVGTSTITDRVYYPATTSGQATATDLSGAPYPIVAMIHGATGDPDYYDELCAYIVSYGYVVASLGGMPPFQESHLNMANETKELVDWVVAESAAPSSPYAGLSVDGEYVAVGHSRGGAAAQYLIGFDPRVVAVVGLEPSFVNNLTPLGNIAAWDGHWLFVSGDADTINPVSEVKNIYKKATGASRRIFLKILGGGHAGPLDPDIPGVGGDPMPHAEQLDLHQWLTLAYIEAELRGVEDAHHEIIGDAALNSALTHETICPDPVLWVVEQASVTPATIAFGVAGSRNDLALIAISTATASIPTPYGELLIDPATAVVLATTQLSDTGTLEVVVPVPPSASGLVVHAQGFVIKPDGTTGALSRADQVLVP